MEPATLTVTAPEGATPEAVMRERLKAARGVSGLSARIVGEKIGEHFSMPAIGADTIYDWEKQGNIPGVYLGAIATALNVEFEFFRL